MATITGTNIPVVNFDLLKVALRSNPAYDFVWKQWNLATFVPTYYYHQTSGSQHATVQTDRPICSIKRYNNHHEYRRRPRMMSSIQKQFNGRADVPFNDGRAWFQYSLTKAMPCPASLWHVRVVRTWRFINGKWCNYCVLLYILFTDRTKNIFFYR